MRDLALYQTGNASIVRIEEVTERAWQYVQDSRAKNTAKAYRADWQGFVSYCQDRGVQSLPASPDTVVLYITERAEHCKPSTIGRLLVSISEAHKTARHKSPVQDINVQSVWKGIKRTKGVAQEGKDPLLTEDVKALIESRSKNTLNGIRDRALLLIGFAGAFRRSELVSLNAEDLTYTRDGLEILLRRSKTDQDGQGFIKAIPYASNPEHCPIRTLQLWQEKSGIQSGPLFRPVRKNGQMQDTRLSDKGVARIVKAAALAAGLDPAKFAGHSLRSGFATQAAKNGSSDRAIMNQTGHRSRTMVDRYVRRASVWQENAATRLNL
jgi:site-specific recombinase XerD